MGFSDRRLACDVAPDLAAASCLALMRAGEQSAAHAFARIMKRLSPGEHARLAQSVAPLVVDELRHDSLLADCAAALPAVAADFGARRFFRRLETREPGVHLARIAGIDACTCQILGWMLAPVPRALLSARLCDVLGSIRRDEGSHLRTARRLSLELGVEAARFQEITRAVRHSFAVLLKSRTVHFEALGIDSAGMIQRIDRDG